MRKIVSYDMTGATVGSLSLTGWLYQALSSEERWRISLQGIKLTIEIRNFDKINPCSDIERAAFMSDVNALERAGHIITFS